MTPTVNSKELDRVYRRYGFEAKPSPKGLRVYTMRRGYFHNADIVDIGGANDQELSRTRREFEAAGYACTIRRYASISAAERGLFEGFFDVETTSTRLREKHRAFVASQTQLLGSDYSYVNCPYSIGGQTGQALLVPMVVEGLRGDGARMVIVEAAAGFGKTCTAYEVLRSFLDVGVAPIFSELSRNRQASIFRYVLLDEIDRNYPALQSDLVISEIRRGTLPLIVDGFDELLRSETGDSSRKDFEDSESMLDTISELLEENAKVLLTTRRTALFTGDEFQEWLGSRNASFQVLRIVLHPPSVLDWLGAHRLRELETVGIPVLQLANPVLLAFLRSIDDEMFSECCQTQGKVIEKYFRSLLDREQERQALRMDADTQLMVFRKLAQAMMDLDINSECRDFIAHLIKETSANEIEQSRRAYPSSERPTSEQLADKLSSHALLDRVGRESESVGFVNDFVAGSLMGDVICEDASDNWIGTEATIDLATTAYAARSDDDRRALACKLEYSMQALTPSEQLQVDLRLHGRPVRKYEDATFDSFTLRDLNIGGSAVFERCTFVRCDFHRVTFDPSTLPAAGFVECNFYGCTIAPDLAPRNGRWQRACSATPDDSFLKQLTAHSTAPPEDDATDYQQAVLRQFWQQGKPYAQPRLRVRTLYRGFPNNQYQEVQNAIDELRSDGLLEVDGSSVTLVKSRMSEVRRRLGMSQQ